MARRASGSLFFWKPKRGHQGVVGGGFPVLAQVLVQGHYVVGFALHALQQGALHHHRARDFGHQAQQGRAGQWRGGRGFHQRLVAGQQLGGQAGVQGQGRNAGAVGAGYVGIVLAHDVQNYLVVLGVGLVLVAGPVGGAQVDFHGPVPFHLAQAQAGIQEIGAGVGVAVAGLQHLDFLAVGGAQVGFIEILVLPDVVVGNLRACRYKVVSGFSLLVSGS